MSDHESPGPPVLPRRTNAITRKSRWPGWIWSVPIAAVGIVAWLGVRSFSQRGLDVTVTFTDAAGMKANDTKVIFRGLEIGDVRKVELTPDRRHVLAYLDLDKSIKADLTTGTRFYLQGAELSLSDPSSLKAIVSGPSVRMIAGTGRASREFTGSLGRPPDRLSVNLPYVVHFEGDVGKLKPGAVVSLQGFTVGEVSKVDFMTDSEAGRIITTAVLDLDPTRFRIRKPPAGATDWDQTLRATLGKLVQNGLRATLTQSPLVVGNEQVDLVMESGVDPAELLTSGAYPEIPSENGGLGTLPAKLGQLPIRQIGNNVRAITEQVKKLTASPQLQDSISHLDRSLGELDQTLQVAGPRVAPTLASVQQTVDRLRQTAQEVDGTAEAARRLLGGSAASPNGNLQQAVRELTGTARAIRTLANYLDQHPEALIRGRGGELQEERR